MKTPSIGLPSLNTAKVDSTSFWLSSTSKSVLLLSLSSTTILRESRKREIEGSPPPKHLSYYARTARRPTVRLTLASPMPVLCTLPRRARAEIRRRVCWSIVHQTPHHYRRTKNTTSRSSPMLPPEWPPGRVPTIRRCQDREDRSLLPLTRQEHGGRPGSAEGDVLDQGKRR